MFPSLAKKFVFLFILTLFSFGYLACLAQASSCGWVSTMGCATDSNPYGAYCDEYNCYCGPPYIATPELKIYRCAQPAWIAWYGGKLCNWNLQEVTQKWTCNCDLKVTTFNSSVAEITSGQSVSFSGTITDSSGSVTWTITLPNGQVINGTGKTPSATWNGTVSDGNPVPAGVYTAVLTAYAASGSCSDTLSAQVTAKSALAITSFNASGPLDPNAGGSVTFQFTVDPSSYDSATISIDGQDIGGTTWNGMLNGKVVDPGTYTATLTVTKDGESATKDLTIHVDGFTGCPLLVTVGSKANVASGELVNSLDLFSSSGTGPSLGMSLYYGSLDAYDSSLGTGWSDSYDIFVTKDQSGDVVLHQGNGVRRLYTLSGSSYTSQSGDTSVLTKNSDGTFQLTREDGTRFAFNADGKVATITDRNGNALTFSYAGGLLQSVFDGAGRSVSFSYDASGKLASVTDPAGKGYSFSVGESLSSVVLPGGGSWSYVYDAGSFLSSKTDPNGNTTTYAYDAEHRLISSTDPSGNTRSLSYPAAGATTTTTAFTEQDGGVWQYSYDTASGNLLSKTDPQGNVTSYTYDANHDLLTKTDPSGTTTYTYDANGNPTSVTDPLSQTTGYTYNSFGEVTSVTDPSNHVTSYAYDTNGNLTSVTDPTGALTKVTYDSKGRITSVTSPTGGTTTIAYDAAGNPASVTGPTGAVTTSTYDAAGRVTSQTDANGQTTTYAYDAAGHLVQATDPLGHTTTFTYDAAGNKISQTDANGNTTTFAYDSLGHVVKMTDANGAPTSFGYGESAGCPSCGGNEGPTLSSLTDANGHATTFQYDTNGRLTQETDPLGRSTLYSYDANGHLASKTDPDGHTVSYSYDALGRLVKKSYPDGTSATFSYDAQGNLLTAANANASYTFTYDAAGHVTSVTDGSGNKVSYAYDAAGRRILLEAPNGKDLLYRYDAAGRLSTLVLDSGSFGFSYDKLGRRSTLTYPNVVVAHYGYDNNSDLTSLQYTTHHHEPFASFTYTLDAVGNRLSMTSGRRTTTYGYDKIYQLLQAATRTRGFISAHDRDRGHGNADHAQEALETHKAFYQYDPVGNRQKSTWVKNYTHDAGNELLSAGHVTYHYDNDGNLIEKDTPAGAVLYSWDAENELTQVTLPDGSTVSFKYDPFGRRIEKKVVGRRHVETLRYIYDGANILFTTEDGDNGGAPSRRGHQDKHCRNTQPAPLQGTLYIQGPGADEHLAFIRDGKTFYYHADGLGSIVALTDEHGDVVQKYAYDAFGNFEAPGLELGRREHAQVNWYNWFTDGRSLFGDGNHQISYNDERAPATYGNAKDTLSQPYGFTGREYDPETGLYYYRARYYDPMAGRFIGKDPIDFAGGDVNLYRYVQNNPINFIDPLGLFDFRYYGNYGGPGWTAGEWSSWEEIKPGSTIIAPIDSQDFAYLRHDQCYGICRKSCNKDKQWTCFNGCDNDLVQDLLSLGSSSFNSDIHRYLAIPTFIGRQIYNGLGNAFPEIYNGLTGAFR